MKHLLCSVLVGSILVVTGCKSKHNPSVTVLPTAQVSVQKIGFQEYPIHEELLGTLRSGLRAAIEAKITGRVENIFVAPGQLIGAGQTIAELDIKEIQAKLDQALALREQSEKEERRYAALLAQKAAPQQEYDAIETRYRVAKAAVTEAEAMKAYGQIVAPFSGLVTKKNIDVGDLASPGRPIIEMEDPSALQVETNIPEDLIKSISLGQSIEILTSRGQQLATVIEISPRADPNSRTFAAKLQIKHELDLRSGQLVRVLLPLGQKKSLFAPIGAIIKRGQMELAYIAQDNKAILRIVKTGQRRGNLVEILSGLDAEEELIVKGMENLVSGQSVIYQP